jgi:type IV pilus assembly protein PilY1
VGNGGQPVFRARAGTAASTAQPITTRPQVVRHPLGKDGFIVLFGTGKYLELGDHEPGSATAPQTTQSFYGIWDRIGTSGSNGTTILRSKLLPQVIYDEQSVVAGGTTTSFRLTTDRSMTWFLGTGLPTVDTTVAGFDPNNAPCAATATGCYLGWRIDLLNTNGPDGPDADSLPGNDNWGERQVTDSVVRGGKIIFTTLIPTNDPCQFGGDGWLMELDAATGSRLSYTPFDVNKDGAFGLSDYLPTTLNPDQTGSTQTPVSGRKSKVGIPTTPAIVARDGGTSEFKYESGSTGQVEVIYENPGPEDVGRQSWQQLFR